MQAFGSLWVGNAVIVPQNFMMHLVNLVGMRHWWCDRRCSPSPFEPPVGGVASNAVSADVAETATSACASQTLYQAIFLSRVKSSLYARTKQELHKARGPPQHVPVLGRDVLGRSVTSTSLAFPSESESVSSSVRHSSSPCPEAGLPSRRLQEVSMAVAISSCRATWHPQQQPFRTPQQLAHSTLAVAIAISSCRAT